MKFEKKQEISPEKWNVPYQIFVFLWRTVVSLQEQIEQLRRDLVGTSEHPTNEANTCSWVILPLLYACGYTYREISQQEYNRNNQYPDFTVLPNTPHTWYLEAKSWTHALHASDANQALNYAHTQGKRWVVLSNGRVWQLYDSHLVGVPTPERLMATAHLECPDELEAFLSALHKNSMQSDAIAQFASQGRLNSLLEVELKDANSELLRAMTKILRSRPGLSVLSPHSLVAWFSKQPVAPAVPAKPAKSVALKPKLPTPSAETVLLADLIDKPHSATGRTPCALLLPDMTSLAVHSWRDIAVELTRWLYQNGKMPTLPFSGQTKGKRYFLNLTPNHIAKPMVHYVQLTIGEQSIYLHTNRSAVDFLLCLGSLCHSVGESPKTIRIELE